jgi:hypothetical protein
METNLLCSAHPVTCLLGGSTGVDGLLGVLGHHTDGAVVQQLLDGSTCEAPVNLQTPR